MKHSIIILFLLIAGWANAQPANDECETALILPSLSDYCSENGAFTNIGATESFVNRGNDVWFKFVASYYDLYITVAGAGSGGTLQSPVVGMFTNCEGSGIVGSSFTGNNVTTFYTGGLIPGRTYYISVSGANKSIGTFKLCYRNETPIPRAGQDCSTASFLCSKASFTQLNVSGPGADPDEVAGSCLAAEPGKNSESNSAWYKWKAANNGTLVFTITPTNTTDDIDWVLYDLGVAGNCPSRNATPLRCAAGHGVDNSTCPSEAMYYKTGLSFTATDISEEGGCGQGQNGVVKFVDMEKDHIYALLVNNFSTGNNGFKIDFADANGVTGTGEFVGPVAKIGFTSNQPCTPAQNFTFTSLSTGQTSLRWTFGDDASIQSATTAGPFTITYSTPGTKTVVLQADGDNGCYTVDIRTFTVGTTPATPAISINKPTYCLKDTLKLTTPDLADATFLWTGPNNFVSSEQNLSIPITDYTIAGTYALSVKLNGCTSDVATITVPEVLKNPTAAFSTDPAIPNKLSLPILVTFFNESIDADTFLWDFGDGTTSTDISPAHQYTSSGDFIVTLTAFKSNVCNASVTKGKLVTRFGNGLFIPNTFTPNGDGINDEFVVTLININSYRIQIFNRWGEQLFESQTIFDNWKGTNSKGESMPVGTYFYVLNAIDRNGESIKKSGSITVIR